MLNTALGDRAARVMMLIITVIAIIGALQYAESFMAPFVFALVLGVVVSPLSEKLTDLGLPRSLSATAMLILTTAFVVAMFLIIEPLISLMVERLPELRLAVESWIEAIAGVLRGIEDVSEQIEATVGAENVETSGGMPSVGDALWLAPNLGAQVVIFVGTFFFFLLTRHEIYAATGSLEKRFYRADALVSRYFAAITFVNIGVGVATGGLMLLIGVEYALLWGLAAGVLNYIIYLGPMIIVGGLLIAGLIQFAGAMAFLPPLAFLMVNMTEAQFVTPMVVGQHVKTNPLVVFLSVVFGLWLWGPIGAIVALPVILWLSLMMRAEGEKQETLRTSLNLAS